MKEKELFEIIEHSLVSGSLSGLSVDLILYPLDTIKTRLQEKKSFQTLKLFSSLYSGVGSVLIGSAPSSALFFTTYNLTKENLNLSSNSSIHIISAVFGEISACLLRVPVEVVKQRAQINENLSLRSIARSTIQNEGFFGLYRGYFATLSREIPFSIIQFPLWEFFKKCWRNGEDHSLSPWQGAICGSIAGGIAASITTPFDVAKTRIIIANYQDADAFSHSWTMIKKIRKKEGFKGLYSGVIPRTIWMSIGGLIYFGAFEFSTSHFFGKEI